MSLKSCACVRAYVVLGVREIARHMCVSVCVWLRDACARVSLSLCVSVRVLHTVHVYYLLDAGAHLLHTSHHNKSSHHKSQHALAVPLFIYLVCWFVCGALILPVPICWWLSWRVCVRACVRVYSFRSLCTQAHSAPTHA